MDRIYHTWDKWECYPAGLYESRPPLGMTQAGALQAYADFLSNLDQFESGLKIVLGTWPRSCEHYLSNEKMNRIAWLGQAAMCAMTGVPKAFSGGYNLLTSTQKLAADSLALVYLNQWLTSRGEPTTDLAGAGINSKVDLY